jgi:hypothetical protein
LYFVDVWEKVRANTLTCQARWQDEQRATHHSNSRCNNNNHQPSTTPAHKLNLRPFSCITSSTLSDFHHRQHQQQHVLILATSSAFCLSNKGKHRPEQET